ncbi:hypothetical protein BKA70DRAFT_1381995 [Coprinopsis sp. MPI-PUGE-AT-0042]|nr:hypothetical protein BKA70DRAFT_1381995 [Coprinopsis sp. MPI-PUGE-AT-0042]
MSPVVSVASLVPDGFAYVGASLLSTVFLLLGQGFVVSAKRSKAKVDYPNAYADSAVAASNMDALIFNCAQRAHQNTLENIPMVYVTTIITGLKYPIPAAAACAAWVVSRIFYTRGYISGNPKKRVSPFYFVGTLSMLASLLTATYTAGSWIMAHHQ